MQVNLPTRAALLAVVATGAMAATMVNAVASGTSPKAPSATAQTPAGPTSKAVLPGGRTAAQISSYWTASRMASAKDDTAVSSDASTPARAKATAASTSPAAAVPTVTAARIFSRPGATKSTLGRFYLTFGTTNYVCSASIVYTDQLITAGHCLWDTETGHGWAKNMMFIPGDGNNGASAPYGRWYGTRWYVSPSFTHTAKYRGGKLYGNWQFDMGLVRIATQGGHHIGTSLGYQGVRFNSHPANLTVVGYPTAKPFTGKSERYCSNPNYSTEAKYWALVIPCNMTNGASGGAWLSAFSTRSGLGLVTAVTSRIGGGHIYGTQFGHTAYEVMRAGGFPALSPAP